MSNIGIDKAILEKTLVVFGQNCTSYKKKLMTVRWGIGGGGGGGGVGWGDLLFLCPCCESYRYFLIHLINLKLL